MSIPLQPVDKPLFKGCKFLSQGMLFELHTEDKKFIMMWDPTDKRSHVYGQYAVDWSDHVTDWDILSDLRITKRDKVILLKVINNELTGELRFINREFDPPCPFVLASNCISNHPVTDEASDIETQLKEVDKELEDIKIKRECLDSYSKYQKVGNEIMIALTAYMDAGFTRKEAFKLILAGFNPDPSRRVRYK